MSVTMQQKLSHIITEFEAFKQTYKAEIEEHPAHLGSTLKEELDMASDCLTDAMYVINNAEPEEHANSSAANSKDYQAEERATTDRGND